MLSVFSTISLTIENPRQPIVSVGCVKFYWKTHTHRHSSNDEEKKVPLKSKLDTSSNSSNDCLTMFLCLFLNYTLPQLLCSSNDCRSLHIYTLVYSVINIAREIIELLNNESQVVNRWNWIETSASEWLLLINFASIFLPLHLTSRPTYFTKYLSHSPIHLIFTFMWTRRFHSDDEEEEEMSW